MRNVLAFLLATLVAAPAWADLAERLTLSFDAQDWVSLGGGGPYTGDVYFGDTVKLCLGNDCDYWLIYNLSGTQFEIWTSDKDGGGTDGELMTCTGGTDQCTFYDELNLVGGGAISADSVKLTWGGAGATDSYGEFDGTNLRFYSSGSVLMLAPLEVGTLEFEADTGPVTGINMEVSSTPSAGDEMSITIALDSTNNVTAYCEADGSGGVEDCHFRQAFSPVLVPSSDQALAGDASFDCDEGVNRIVGSGGAVTLSAAPSINDGDLDGQICYVEGNNDTNTVTINDNTNVQLAGGAAFTMGKGDMLKLVWDAGDGDWYELSRSDN